MSIIDAIHNKLQAGLCPTHLALFNDSNKHIGHAEAQAHGGLHLRCEITSDRFTGLHLVARHRLVYGLLAEEWGAKKIHALQMTLLTPDKPSPTAL